MATTVGIPLPIQRRFKTQIGTALIQTFDGVGRVIGAASYHPGSAGGYKAQLTQYDNMGRIMKQSNPSEIIAGWVPSGDYSAGWLYTQQSYDWNGRPLITTNTDLTTKSASYGGCGCAGGAVVTFTVEGTLIDPINNSSVALTTMIRRLALQVPTQPRQLVFRLYNLTPTTLLVIRLLAMVPIIIKRRHQITAVFKITDGKAGIILRTVR
jgi:hypothetical protein